MASGHRTLTHKVETLIHMFHFDIPADAPLEEILDSIMSHTSDMGIEMGVPSYEVGDVSELLPVWIDRSELKAARYDGDPNPPAARAPGPFEGGDAEGKVVPNTLLRSAFIIYGLQHTTNNLNSDVNTSLMYWNTFWGQLKNFEALLYAL